MNGNTCHSQRNLAVLFVIQPPFEVCIVDKQVQLYIQGIIMQPQTINTFDDFKQKVLTRYAIFDRPLSGEKNVIVDSFFPAFYLKSMRNTFYSEELPATAAAISEFTAEFMSVPLVPRQDLVEMLGFSVKDINNLMNTVKAKKLTLHMIGLGGTNSNTLYWLYQLALLTNTPNLFKQLLIQEPDNLSIDNLIRMPMNPLVEATKGLSGYIPRTTSPMEGYMWHVVNKQNTYDKADKYDKISYPLRYYGSGFQDKVTVNPFCCTTNTRQMPKLSLVKNCYQYLSSSALKLISGYFVPRERYIHILNARNSYYNPTPETIYYGAPDIATRQAMQQVGKILITATHGDNEATLALNPIQDTQLQRESYGVIRLGVFFMNQLRLAIGLLQTLASDQDLTEQNKTLLDYTYSADASKCKRTWKVQELHDGLLRSDI